MMKNNLNEVSSWIDEGCLVTAGKVDNHNTMTIGWGQIGTIWHKRVFTCYVRPTRYTYKFMEENEYFTISFYNKEYRQAMGILGTKSGRDCDKESLANFHPVDVDGVSTTFSEAKLTILCKKIYIQDLDENLVPEDVKNRYYNGDTYHRIYMGEIIKIL